MYKFCVYLYIFLFYTEIRLIKLSLCNIFNINKKKAPQKTEVLNSIVAIGIEPMTHGI